MKAPLSHSLKTQQSHQYKRQHNLEENKSQLENQQQYKYPLSASRGSDTNPISQYGKQIQNQGHRTFTDFNPTSNNQISSQITLFAGVNSHQPAQHRNQPTIQSQQYPQTAQTYISNNTQGSMHGTITGTGGTTTTSGTVDKFQYYQPPHRANSTSRGYMPLTNNQQHGKDQGIQLRNNINNQNDPSSRHYQGSGMSNRQTDDQNNQQYHYQNTRMNRSQNYQPSSDRHNNQGHNNNNTTNNDMSKYNTNPSSIEYASGHQQEEEKQQIPRKKIYPKNHSYIVAERRDQLNKTSAKRYNLDQSPHVSANKSLYSYQREHELASSINSKMTPTNLNNVSKFAFPIQTTEINTKFVSSFQTQDFNAGESQTLLLDLKSSHQGLPYTQPTTLRDDLTPTAGIANNNLNNDMEQIIMNLHNKMKNLESKYLDLANFYKKELVSQKQQNTQGASSSSHNSALDHKKLSFSGSMHDAARDINIQSDNNVARFQQRRDIVENSNQSRSPFRSDNVNNNPLYDNPSQTAIMMDQKVEKTIISELLKEKKELENELQNMIHIQGRQQEEEDKLQVRFEVIEQENHLLKQKHSSSNQGKHYPLSQELREQLMIQVQTVLEKFEKEFLDYINNHYQSFTENDVLGLFGNLKKQVSLIVESILTSQKQPNAQLDEQIIEDQKKLLESYKKDLSEFEINNEYTHQNFKKSLFELSNKHDTSKLDMKKINLTLSTLYKTSQELANLQNGQNSNHKDRVSQFSGGFERSGDNSSNNKSAFMDSNKSPQASQTHMHTQRLTNTIINQVQTLSQSMQGLSNKFSEGDKILNDLQSIQDENKKNLQFLKQSFDHLLIQFDQQYKMPLQAFNNQLSDRSLTTSQQQQHHSQYQQQHFQILESELCQATQEIQRLKLQNTQLQSKYNTIEQQNYQQLQQQVSSPTFRKLANQRNSHDVVQDQKNHIQSLTAPDRLYEGDNQASGMAQIQQNFNQIEQENKQLIKQIKTLNRTVDERSQEVQRLGNELNHLSNINVIKNESMTDQVLYFQQLADQHFDSLRTLFKLTQRFLSSMKKLQKAVHRKEPNVAKEKGEFEVNRKDLESMLKQLKKEFDKVGGNNNNNSNGLELGKSKSMDKQQQQQNPYYNEQRRQPMIQQQQRYNSGNRASSLGDRISNDENPAINSDIDKYQNKVPHTFSARNQVPLHNKTVVASHLPYHYQQQQQQQQINPTSSVISSNRLRSLGNQSLAVSSIYNEGGIGQHVSTLGGHNLTNTEDEASLDRSPVITMRIGRNQIPPTEGFRSMEGRIPSGRDNKGNIFHSIDTVGQQQRSPSVHQEFNRNKFSLQDPARSSAQQVNEVGKLRLELNDLLHEREGLTQQLAKSEREKDLILMDKQQLENRLDKDHKKSEAMRRQLNELELERDSMIQELMRSKLSLRTGSPVPKEQQKQHSSQSSLNPSPLDAANLQIHLDSLNQKNTQLFDQLEILEKINQEYKRTIGYLEESADVAKSTITELRESLSAKELEIEELMVNNQKYGGSKKQNEDENGDTSLFERQDEEFESIKEELKGQIERVEEGLQMKVKGIENLIGSKEKEIKRLQNIVNKSDGSTKVKGLNKQIQGLEEQLLELKESMDELEQDNMTKNKQITGLQQQLQTQRQNFENQLQHHLQNQHQLTALQSSAVELQSLQVQLSTQQESYESQLTTQRQSHDLQLSKLKANHEKLLTKIKQDHESQLTILQQNEQENLDYQTKHLQDETDRKVKEAQLKAKKDLDIKVKEANEKHTAEINRLKQEYEAKLQDFNDSPQHQLQSTELEHQLQALKSTQEKEKLRWDSDKSRLEGQIRDLREQFKKQMAGKDQDIEQLRLDHEQEIEEIRSQKGQNEAEMQNNMGQRDKQIKQMKQELQKLQIEREHQVQQVSTEYESHIEQLQQDLQQQIDDLSVQVNKLQKEKESLIQQHQKDIIQLKQVQSKIQEQLNTQLRQKEEQILNLTNQISDQEGLIEQLQSDGSNTNTLLQQQIDHLKNQAKLKENQIENYKTQINSINQRLQEKEEELEDLSNQKEEQNQIFIKLQEKFNILTKQKQDSEIHHESQIKALNKKHQDLGYQHKELDHKYNQLMEEQEEERNENDQKVEQLQQKLIQLEDEIKSKKQVISQKDEHIKSVESKLSLGENENNLTKSLQLGLQQQLEKLTTDLQEAKSQHLSSEQSLQETQSEMSIQKQDYSTLNHQLQTLMKDKKAQELHLTQLQSDLDLSKKDYQQTLDKKDKLISDLQTEKERAQDQLRQIVTDTQVEKQSVEERLQHQLNQTMQDLKLKEKELKSSTLDNEKLNKQLQEALTHELSAKQTMVQLQNDSQSQQLEIDSMNDKILKKQQSLEQNKSLITMLKTELQKNIEIQKQKEEESEKLKSDNEKNLEAQVESYKEQIHKLKQQYEDRNQQYKIQIQNKDKEYQKMNELVEEANKVIEEFSDEKHNLKAKFKHLIQMLDNVQEESMYHEDDDIDLDSCLQRFEREFLLYKSTLKSHISTLQKDIISLKSQLTLGQSELALIQSKSQDLNNQLAQALTKLDNNDTEFRKQLEVGQRKIQNYKEKVIEKQKIINNLEQEKRELQQSRQERTIGGGGGGGPGNTSLRDVELLQRLQKAENELQTYRQAHQNKQRILTPDDSMNDMSMRVDLQRINQMEEQLQSLRKQLFQAKDQVVSALSETFAKKLKDISKTYQQDNILKSKLSELKTDQQVQGLNNNIKFLKQVQFNNKKLLLVQAQNNNECYIIDESKLGDIATDYLKSFIPTNDKELETTFLQMDENQQQVLTQLEDQLMEIREERQELQQELSIYKNKMVSGNGFEDLKDLKLIELEDDVGHLTSENQELRLNMKDLIQQNVVLKIRVIELNEMIKDITNKAGGNQDKKIHQLIEDNENLRQQINAFQSKQQRNSAGNFPQQKISMLDNDEDEDYDNGSFLKGIQVAANGGNGNTSQNQDDNQNFFDQSSLYGVIQGIEGDNGKQQFEVKIQQLQTQVEELQVKNKQLQSDLTKKDQQLNKEDQGIISHVKGTLIQFLKNCPMTDKNNEILLEVVLSVMEFSKEEMVDLNDVRRRARSSSVSNINETEDDVKNRAKKGIFNMFTKNKQKESSVVRKPQDLVSPIRPVQRR